MLKCLIALTSLFSVATLAAPAWTWVDEQGRRHYSDRPVEGATQIELTDTQTFEGAAPRSSTAPAGSAESNRPAGGGYSVLDVVSPASQETLHNIEGNLSVSIATNPALQAGHRVDAILDGDYRKLGARSLNLTLTEVYRGEHTLQAVIVDSSGAEIKRSAPVTFFVRQTSVN